MDVRYERIRRARRAGTFTDAEGAWNLDARGPADEGARFQAVLDPIIDEIFTERRRNGDVRERREAYAFDALMRLADRAATPPSADTDRKPRMNPRLRGIIRVDHAALVRGWVEGEEVCEITGTGPVPVRVARERLGESALHLVITKGKDVATTVSLGRGPTAAQKIALAWMKPKCTNGACSGTFTQVDHRIEFAKTKHTVLGELDPLCDVCHPLKTNKSWALEAGTGRRAFVPPHDPRHPRHPENRNRPPP